MLYKHSVGIILVLSCLLVTAEVRAGDHDEHHHGHGHNTIEMKLSNAVAFTLGEKEFAYGLHTHAIYTFGETQFALGLGYELTVGHHTHHTIGPMFCYRPTDPLNFCVSPGVLMDEHDVAFAAHIEATYEFNLHGVHVGPTVGFAYTPEEMHISVGVHTGVEF